MVRLERLQYRPEIDGLRAVAVLAVIINHFDKGALPYGYLGVDIFFVISGFVITATLVRQNDISLGSFLVSFYSRRLRRLMPSLLFVAAISSLFVCVFHPDPQESILTGVASLFGLSNLFLLKQSTDYFAASTELNAFTHTWSLGVEEQFYFVLPIMTYFLLLNKQGGKKIRNFGLTIGAFAIGSWLFFCHVYETNRALAYFSMPSRFWELAAGCLIYLIFTTKAASYIRKYVHALTLLILLVVALALPQQVGGPVFRVTAVVTLTSLLILVVRKDSLTHSLLSHKLFVFIGVISYSLYLWHWPILSLSRLTIGVHYFTIPAQLLLIFALASLTFYKIETPFRSGNRGNAPMDFHPLSKGICAGLAVSVAMLFLAYKASHRIYVGRILNVDYPIWIRKPWFAGADGSGIDVCSSATEITVQQAQDCLKLNPKSLTTAYVIGDSHARNYVPAVQSLFGLDAVRYLTVGNECSYSPPVLQNKYRGNIKDCLGYVNDVTTYLERNVRQGDIVFVGQRLFVDNGKERQGDDYFDHILSLSQKLANKHVPLVLLDGTYPPSKIPQECYPLPWKPFVAIGEGCYVHRKEVKMAFGGFEKQANFYQRRENNFFYAPLREGLCKGDVCGQFMPSGTAIWRDMGHITDAASRELWLPLRRRLIEQKINSRYPKVVFRAP